jgi:hypothetical protein
MNNNPKLSVGFNANSNISYTTIAATDDKGITDSTGHTNKTELSTLLKDGHKTNSIPDQTFWERILSWRFVIVLLLHASYSIMTAPVISMSFILVCMCGPILPPETDRLLSNTTNMSSVSPHDGITTFSNETFSQVCFNLFS